ncbi:RNA polymerase sigma-70 factor [soil metagenome]
MRKQTYDNEHELLCCIATGNQEAFRSLFEQFKNKVYSFAAHFTHSDFIAEEITQEVFIKIWMSRETLPEINNIEAWIITLTKNCCFNQLKKKALEMNMKAAVAQNEVMEADNVAEYIFYKDRLSILKDAMEELSPQQRLIFRLNREDGLKNEEIAHQLNIAPNTVKTHMVTALRKIREFMQTHPASFLLSIGGFLKFIFK